MDEVVYRLSWSMPDSHQVVLLQSAGVPYEAVPDDAWHRISRTATAEDGILQQARQLKQWADDKTEYVRDVVLQRQVLRGADYDPHLGTTVPVFTWVEIDL